MELDFLSEYCTPVIVGICLCVGFILKKWVKDVDNKYIPTLCAALGIVLSVWIHRALTPTILLSGFFSGLAATGTHQLVKTGLLPREP